LEEIVIPGTVETIGANVFAKCSGLTSLTIGKNVTAIEHTAFTDCVNLEKISVSPENTAFRATNNCLIEIATKTLRLTAKGCQIPADGSVTVISGNAFAGQTHLQELVIPEGVKSLPKGIFEGCSALTSLTLPQSLESLSESFDDCHALKTIHYNGTVAQWKAMNKPSTWTYRVLIHCSNGDLYTR
jgi:hypothetical protein